MSFFKLLVLYGLIARNDYKYAAYLKGAEDKCDKKPSNVCGKKKSKEL